MSGAQDNEHTHANLGEVVLAGEVVSSGPSPRRARSVIILLASSVGLMMTGFGIILPVFARRLGEFGSGVEALGLMTMSFALAQLVAAPFMGSLADRYGRRFLGKAGRTNDACTGTQQLHDGPNPPRKRVK